MRPDVAELRQLAPDVDERLMREHLSRLPDAYFESFASEAIGQHLQALAGLSAVNPVATLVDAQSVTVLAFDHASAFSLICGVLASAGFGIVSGDVFTYAPPAALAHGRARRDPLGRLVLDPYRRRRIVDRFVGGPVADITRGDVQARLAEVMAVLEESRLEDARARVNEWVADRLRQSAPLDARLFPVRVEVTAEQGFTRLAVESQDTPAFLYAFSTGLSLHRVSIERVRIATRGQAVQDEIDVTGPDGAAISDPRTLELLRVSAVLTKHFTSFLHHAPNPSAALARFNILVQDVFERGGKDALSELLESGTMQALARVLGASDFLWEDFVRVQYESLLPFLHPRPDGQPLSAWLDEAPRRLDEALAGATSFDDKRRCLNAYKDREAFMIDLEHILSGGQEVARLSARLTSLAERVVDSAAGAVYADLGRPEGRYAILGLGKLGGQALGYASDLELLLVYDGGSPEAFASLVQGITMFIQAKEDGLFQIDLKLRPFGIDGPLAASLDGFASYYGPGGPAHSLERLSLTRLRAVGGDAGLGRQVEALRDQVLYEVPSISLDELRTTRLLQFEQKSRPGAWNAKYSPGALVDVEYATEILQVLHGKNHPPVRGPRTQDALRALQAIDVLSAAETDQLVGAYELLGRLINGLRMLRGWSADLFLPTPDSAEFAHLARRMGYQPRTGLSASRKLHVEIETRTAAVRAFVERRFGRAGLPGPVVANVADLVLSDSIPADVRDRVLRAAGFRDPRAAYTNLRRLAGEDDRRLLFAQLAVLACESLARQPDPDGAFDAWRRHVDDMPDPEAHFRALLADPSRIAPQTEISSTP